MLKKYFLPFFLLASSCSSMGQTENVMSFVEQLKSVPIWTEKKGFDTDSNVLYRLSVNTNGDIQYYDSTWQFVSSSSPNRAVYSVEDHSQPKVIKRELTLSIQSNSVIIENSPFLIKEFFRSPQEPIDRVFITNLLALPIWYPFAEFSADKTSIERFVHIRMIVDSNGSYYPDNNQLKKSLHRTFVSAKSPTVALYESTYNQFAPDGTPAPLMEIEIETDQLVWHKSTDGKKYSWPRRHEKPADITD